MFPLTIFVLVAATAVLASWNGSRRLGGIERLRISPGYALAVRSAWILVASTGLLALSRDVSAIT